MDCAEILNCCDLSVGYNINEITFSLRAVININKSIARLLAARNIQRPQVLFKTSIDNSNKTPFEPRIKYKPNSIKPLAVLPEYDADGAIEGYLHPYETELNKFEVSPSLLKQKTPDVPKRLEDTPLVYVDTVQQLKQLMETDFVGVSELAVDLEHHSYRTFQVRMRTGSSAG